MLFQKREGLFLPLVILIDGNNQGADGAGNAIENSIRKGIIHAKNTDDA